MQESRTVLQRRWMKLQQRNPRRIASSCPNGIRAHSTQSPTHCSGFCCRFCRCLRSPLRHFFAFVQQRQPEGETNKALITEKLDQLNDEYVLLHSNMTDIVKRAMELSGCNAAFADDPDTVRALHLVARELCFQQWASFQRRIFFPLQQLLGSCCFASQASKSLA